MLHRRVFSSWPGSCIILGAAFLVIAGIYLYAIITPNDSMLYEAPEADFRESIDASIARYTASLTNARLDNPGQPPISKLVITDGATNEVFGSWTLGAKEFWTPDPEVAAIESGSWDVNQRCYTHEVWTGSYTPGSPLTEHESRDFCF